MYNGTKWIATKWIRMGTFGKALKSSAEFEKMWAAANPWGDAADAAAEKRVAS